MQDSCDIVKEISVTIRRVNHCFSIVVKQHHSNCIFFGKTIYEKYLLHLSLVYGIKCLGRICKCVVSSFFACTPLIIWILRSCGLISLKIILIFPKNFLHFRLNMIEELGIINLSSYSVESYTYLVLSDSEVRFLQEEEDADYKALLT